MELDLALLYSFLQLGDVVRADLFLGEVSGEHLIDISFQPLWQLLEREEADSFWVLQEIVSDLEYSRDCLLGGFAA